MSKKVFIEDICDILDNQRIPITANERKKGIYPYFGANGIQDYIDGYIFDEELVLVAEDGGNFGSKDRPIAYRVSGKCWVNNHAHVLRAKTMLDINYLCYSLMFYDVSSIINGATRQKLNKSALRKMEIPLPPLEEQKKIAEELNKISDLIAKRKSQIEKLDLLVKAKFVEMFGDPVENHMGWNTGTIRDIVCEVKYGTSRPAVEGGKYPYLRMNNITYEGHLDISRLKYIDISDNEYEKCVVKNGDVLFNRTNSKELVGKTCVYNLDMPMIIAGYIIRVRVNDENNSIYLSALLNSKYGKEKLFNMCKSIVGQANINAQELQNIKILIPPVMLQNQFADYVLKVEQTKTKIQQGLNQLETLYKERMQTYFE